MQVAGDAFALFFLGGDEPFAQAGQSGLRTLPFGDIHQTVHPADEFARSALDPTDVRNQGKLRAVSPLDRNFHGVWGSAGSQSNSHGHFIKFRTAPALLCTRIVLKNSRAKAFGSGAPPQSASAARLNCRMWPPRSQA